MTINEAGWDRVLRIVTAIAFGLAGWLVWPGTAGIVLVALAAVALVTGLVGWCPAYSVFHVSTRRKPA